MSETKGQETPVNPDEPLPVWEEDEKWGPEFVDHCELLDKLWVFTHWGTQAERDEHYKVAREEVIPLLDRCLAVRPSEEDEAFALFHKYHKPDTGVRDTLLKEYDTLVKDMESRMPQMARAIKFSRKRPILDNHPVISLQRPNEPFVLFNNTTYGGDLEIEFKTYQTTRDLLLKKVALMKDQNDAMARALAKNGIQLPHECVTIQEQLHTLTHFTPDEPALANSGNLRLVSLSQDSSGSGFVGNWEVAEPPVIEAEKTTAREMTKADLEDLLKALHKFKCGKFFETPLTKQQYDGYFRLVQQPRDLVTIKDSLNQDPQYGAREFFNDMRLMIDNYIAFFGEASYEYDMAVRIEQEMLKKLEGYGEAGQTAKTYFKEAPEPEFNELVPPSVVDTNPPPEADETISPSEADVQIDSFDNEEEFDTSYAQGINKYYDDDYREEHDDTLDVRDEVFDNQDGDDHGNYDEHDPWPQSTGAPGPSQQFGSQDGHFNQSPSIQVAAEQPEDEDDVVKKAFDVFDIAKRYDEAHGHATRAPVGRGTAEPQHEDGRDSPSCAASGSGAQSEAQDEPGPDGPSPDTDKPAEQSEEFSILNPYSSSPGAPGPAEQHHDKDSDILSSIASPPPSPAAQLEAVAGGSGDEDAHAGAHALEQPAPVAPMYAEQEIIDLTSSPPRQTSRIDSASTKRARTSDDQDSSSDDDAPLIKRRKTTAELSSVEEPLSAMGQKTAAKSSHYAVTSSLGKRSRDDDNDDGNDEEEREQPAKRNKVSSPSAPEPLAPVAAAAEDGGSDHTSLTIEQLFEPFESPLRQVQEPAPPIAAATVGEPSLETIQNLLRRVRNAQVPPSPIPEPITPELTAVDGPGSVSPPPVLDRRETPEPANDVYDTEAHESRKNSSSPSAAAEEPVPAPATEDLGHTNNGTITPSKLHRLPKYKKKGRSKASGRPNRPWVFGYWFGNEYGLYIMGCPNKGCEMGTEIFTTHPLMRNDAADHLQECGHDFTDDDDMVRKYCTQVISDEKKAVSIEWARKWNEELMKEYGDEDREEENF